MIVALNMSNEQRTFRLDGKELGVKESELRWAISSQRRDANGIVEAGQVKLAPYEAAVFTAPTVPASMAASSRAQAPKEQVPEAKVRELASIDGEVDGWCLLPNGRSLIYQVGDSTFTYDIVTKQRTLLGTDMYPESVSPQGESICLQPIVRGSQGPFPVDHAHRSEDWCRDWAGAARELAGSLPPSVLA